MVPPPSRDLESSAGSSAYDCLWEVLQEALQVLPEVAYITVLKFHWRDKLKTKFTFIGYSSETSNFTD